MRKYLAWKENLDRIILRLVSMGFTTKLLFDPLPKRATKKWNKTYESNVLEPFGWEHIHMSIYFWSGCLCAATCVFLVELTIAKIRKNRKNFPLIMFVFEQVQDL
jgi:virulence-associated protein VapD